MQEKGGKEAGQAGELCGSRKCNAILGTAKKSQDRTGSYVDKHVDHLTAAAFLIHDIENCIESGSQNAAKTPCCTAGSRAHS